MQRPFIAGRNDHRTQSEMTSLDDLRIIMLARSPAADITHLGAAVFGICFGLKIQNIPVRLSIFKTGDVFVDLIDVRNWFVHGSPPLNVPSSIVHGPWIMDYGSWINCSHPES